MPTVAKPSTMRKGRLLIAIAMLLAQAACGTDSDHGQGRDQIGGASTATQRTGTGRGRTIEERVRGIATIIDRADGSALSASAAPNQIVRVEIRDVLVETDERAAETLGREELAPWLARLRAATECTGEPCAYPEGLLVHGDYRCFGDCCDISTAGGLRHDVLHLRRVCLAAREDGSPRLSYLGFGVARRQSLESAPSAQP